MEVHTDRAEHVPHGASEDHAEAPLGQAPAGIPSHQQSQEPTDVQSDRQTSHVDDIQAPTPVDAEAAHADAQKGQTASTSAAKPAKTKAPNANAKKTKAAKDANSTFNASGPTFPLARVSRIVKADRDVETTSKDAIWTIAMATEAFIKHMADSALAQARLDGKRIVTYKELATAVESQPEFFFLQDIVPQPITLEKAFEVRKELEAHNRSRQVGLIVDEDSDEEHEDGDASLAEAKPSTKAKKNKQRHVPDAIPSLSDTAPTAADELSETPAQEPQPMHLEEQ